MPKMISPFMRVHVHGDEYVTSDATSRVPIATSNVTGLLTSLLVQMRETEDERERREIRP